MSPVKGKGGRPVAEQKKITKEDIEDKFRELTGDVEDRAEAVLGTAATVGAVVAVWARGVPSISAPKRQMLRSSRIAGKKGGDLASTGISPSSSTTSETERPASTKVTLASSAPRL